MSAPTIGAVMIALRQARAPWLGTTHITVMGMLASRLPCIRPTGDDLAAETQQHRATVYAALRDLCEHGIIARKRGQPGKANEYTIRLESLRKLAAPVSPRTTQEAGPSVSPRTILDVAQDALQYRPGRHQESEGEASEGTSPPFPPRRSRTVAQPAAPAEGPGKGAADLARVQAAYVSAFREVHGRDPQANGSAGYAAKLLASLGLPETLRRIANAAQSPWWRSQGTLADVARDPDRYASAPAAPPTQRRRADLQPMSGVRWPR